MCWKENATENTAALTSMKCAVLSVKADTANDQAILSYAIYSMKVPGTALVPATDWKVNTTDGSVLFYEGTNNAGASTRGFKTTDLWNQDYAATKATAALATGSLALTKASFTDAAAATGSKEPTAVGLKAMPTVTGARTGNSSAGWKFTTVTIVEASGSLTDFYTQGKLYT